MVQQSCLGHARVDRPGQRLLRALPHQSIPQRPADHGTRVEVEDHRQIEPALRGPDIGDVPGPHLVGGRDRELAIARLRRDGHPMMRLRRGAPLLHGLGPNPFSPHAPCETLFADAVPLLEQGVPDAGTTVGLAGLAMDHPDLCDEHTVGGLTRTLRSPPPGIVARGGDRKRPAHEPNGIATVVSLHRAVSHGDSLAKHAAARVTQSRAWVTRAHSRFTRVSASASAR